MILVLAVTVLWCVTFDAYTDRLATDSALVLLYVSNWAIVGDDFTLALRHMW